MSETAVTDTRRAIAEATDVEAILQHGPTSNVRESEDVALESEALRRANLRIGDQCMSDGRLDKAVVAFVAAGGATEKLVMLGDLSADKRYVEIAVDAYAAAGAKDKLVAFGNRCVEEEWLSGAVDAYIAAGEEIPGATLIATGDRCVEKATDDESNRQRLLESAQKAYVAAGATEKLVMLGDRFVEEGWFWGAVTSYVAAGAVVPVEKLIMCGDRCLEGGWFDTAQKAYEAAGAVMTVDKLMVCGDRCVKEGRLDDARVAYAAAERIKIQQEHASE
jgi:hypothetical protein